MTDAARPQDAGEARVWEDIGDDEVVSVFAEFETDDVETFVDELKAIAERTDMDGFRIEFVARVEAWGPKRRALEFIDEAKQGLSVIKHHE